MKVQRKLPFGYDNQPLGRQIRRATIRLDQRKRSASALGSSLWSRVRSGWASPRGLWIAGGAGFLLAEWIDRPIDEPRPEPRPVRENSSKSSPPSHTVAISNAVLLLKFALDLRNLWAGETPKPPVPAKAVETGFAE